MAATSVRSKAVDETLRYDPQVPAWRRVTSRPTTLVGLDSPAGANLFLWLGAANRSATVFREAETFDLHREDAPGALSFGNGIHYCPGAPLAKLEASMALRALIRRFPELRLVSAKRDPLW